MTRMKRVNVAVILLLVLIVAGLGVTGVYRVRDAANRIKCQNNLHAIGMALQGYHDMAKHFPSATVPNTMLPAEKRLGWMAELWPSYMIGGYLSLLNKDNTWDAAENYPPRWRLRNGVDKPMDALVYVCPAAPSPT